MRSFISFFLVVLFVIIIAIFLFIIMLNSSEQVSAALTEEIKLMELGFNIKNMNSLLASKTPYAVISGVYLPLIDLVIAANFANESFIRSYANNTLYMVIENYLSKNLSFGYCLEKECYNCANLINYPTKYGNIVMCQVEYPSMAATYFNCSK